jgi:hypothetical protein
MCFYVKLPSMGRAGIVRVRISRRVVAIPVARRAVAIVSIATKTQNLWPHPSFNPCLLLRRPRSHCRAWQDAMGICECKGNDFLVSFTSYQQKNKIFRRPQAVFYCPEGSGVVCRHPQGRVPAHCVGLCCDCVAGCALAALPYTSLGRAGIVRVRKSRRVGAIPVARRAGAMESKATKTQTYTVTVTNGIAPVVVRIAVEAFIR